ERPGPARASKSLSALPHPASRVSPPQGMNGPARLPAATAGLPTGWTQQGSGHTRTVQSELPERAEHPSGANFTQVTTSPWPSKRPTSFPVAASHPRTVLSSLLDISRVPSEERATPVIPQVCPL